MTKGARGNVQYADTTGDALREYKLVIVNPGIMDIELIRRAVDPGCMIAAYHNSQAIPILESQNEYWHGLREAMLSRCYKDAGGQYVNFGKPSWPLARVIPNEGNADRMVQFLRTSGTLRQFEIIYADDTEFVIKPWVALILGNLYTPDLPLRHAQYMNRVVSGFAESVGFGSGPEKRAMILGNTAGATHPSLAAISVECKSAQRPGALPRDQAIQCCKKQAYTRGTYVPNILWYSDQGDDASNAIPGTWPGE